MGKKNKISEATGLHYGETLSLKPLDPDTIKATVTAPKMEIDFHGAVVEGFLDDSGEPVFHIHRPSVIGSLVKIKP